MTKTMLQRLLRHPHAAVFDKAPGAELALRVRHPDGAIWSVQDEIITVQAGDADPVSYSLGDYTIGQLAAALQADGFEVPMLSSQWAGRSALALVEGTGDQGLSNGDHVSGFTSLLWALYSGYAGELRDAKYQIGQALRQMVITQAEDEWLDVWGTLYGDSRMPSETDASYAARIPKEAFRLRVNALGIEQAILDATGWNVRIEEPWKEVFTLDQSTLSGPDHFYDGEHYGYHLIRPVTRDFVNWDTVVAIINRNRAAGVLIVDRSMMHSAYIDASDGRAVLGKYVRLSKAFEPYEDRALLDYMLLDDEIIPNRASRRIRGLMHSSESAMPDGEYAVTSAHDRTYRAYYSSVTYEYQFWTEAATWATANSDWTVDAMITSKHTSS